MAKEKNTNKFFISSIISRSLALALFFMSCDKGDGNDRIPVDYQLMAGGNTPVSISFKGANGEPAEVPESGLDDSWSQRIWVPKPFTASYTVELDNATSEDQEYVLRIFVRDEAVATVIDTVLAMETVTGSVSTSVN